MVVVLSVLMLTTLLTGCSSTTGTPKVEKAKVMIYTSIYPDIIEQMQPEIAKVFPDFDVQWFQGGTESVITKITGEIEAKKIEADLLMVADPSYYITLSEQGVLAKYDSKERVNVELKDTEGYWTGVRISNMIIAYNSNNVTAEEAPKSYADLLDPQWKGRIAMPSPLLSGSAYVTAGALSGTYGWEFFDGLKANGMVVESGNSAVQNKLLTGEYDVVIILEENMLKLADKGEPVKIVYPADGVIVIPSPIAMFENSKNKEASQQVLDWFLSKEGQEIIVKGWMHSVRQDVNSPKGADHLSTFMGNSMKLDWNYLAKEATTIKETFRQKLID